MELVKPKGLIAPVFTPFKENGELNLERIDQYASHLIKNDKLDGILVNGTSGEGMSMNQAERKAVAEAWSNAVKDKLHIMIQVGGTSLPDVLELAKHAASIKANSILCLPDLYMKPRNIRELVAYLKLVSDAAPDIPLLYYHIPMFTNVDAPFVDMGFFLKHVRENPECIPTFVGIKYTVNDLDSTSDISRLLKQDFSVFLGADKLILLGSNMGFNSVIATTLNFCSFTQILNKSEVYQTRAKTQVELARLVDIIIKNGCGWVPSMKVAMRLLSIDCGPIRSPMQSLTEEQVNLMKTELEAASKEHLHIY